MNGPTLLDAAAERIAYDTGRAYSQVRAELSVPDPSADALPPYAGAIALGLPT